MKPYICFWFDQNDCTIKIATQHNSCDIRVGSRIRLRFMAFFDCSFAWSTSLAITQRDHFYWGGSFNICGEARQARWTCVARCFMPWTALMAIRSRALSNSVYLCMCVYCVCVVWSVIKWANCVRRHYYYYIIGGRTQIKCIIITVISWSSQHEFHLCMFFFSSSMQTLAFIIYTFSMETINQCITAILSWREQSNNLNWFVKIIIYVIKALNLLLNYWMRGWFIEKRKLCRCGIY